MSTEPEDRFPDLPSMGRALLQFADERDRAIWSPAFETARAMGSPLNPSIPPQGVPSAPPLPLTKPRQTPEKTTLSQATSERTAELKAPVKTGLYWTVALAAVLVAGLVGVYVLKPFESSLGSEGSPGTARPVRSPTVEPAVPVAVKKPGKPAIYRIEVTTDPEDAQLELDGVKVGTGSLTLDLPRDGTAHLLRVSAENHEPREVIFTDRPPPGRIALSRIEDRSSGPTRKGVPQKRREPFYPGGAARPPAPSVPPAAAIPVPEPVPEPAQPPSIPSKPPDAPPPPPAGTPAEFSPNRAPIID
jgi:hypothetical protein